MTQQVEWDSISLANKMMTSKGKVRFASGGLGWKDSKSGKVTTVASQDLKKIYWLRVANQFGLRLVTKNGSILLLSGFPQDAFEEMKRFVKLNYDLEIEVKEPSMKGWNWGMPEFEVFDLPLTEILNASLSSKNEVSLEFKLPSTEQMEDSRELKRGDQLTEIRFYIPDTAEEPEEGVKTSSAEQFLETVKEKAEIGQTIVGESIASFHELPFATPRGRYEVEMFKDFMRMHGKSYDYKILYKSIKKLYHVLKPDQTHSLFVIALDPPIRQGQTRYPYLVLQFLLDEILELDLSLNEEQLASDYPVALQKHYQSPISELVPALFSVLTSVPLILDAPFTSLGFNIPSCIIPKNPFSSHHGAAGFKCALKANEGFFYPMANAFLFLPKPVLEIPYDNVHSVVLVRRDAVMGRTVDMKIIEKVRKLGVVVSGNQANYGGTGEITVNGIEKEEVQGIEEWIKLNNLKVRNEMEGGSSRQMLDDSSGSEMSSDEEEEEDRPRKKQATGGNTLNDMDMGDDESEDEDFVAEEDSDVAEEFDEEYDSGGEGSEEGEESS